MVSGDYANPHPKGSGADPMVYVRDEDDELHEEVADLAHAGTRRWNERELSDAQEEFAVRRCRAG